MRGLSGSIVLLTMVGRAEAYASSMCTSSKSLTAGTTIMGASATSSSSRTVYFQRSGSTLTCGSDTYTSGETLTAVISSTSNQYVLEVSGGSFSSGCDSADARVTSNSQDVVAPTDGSDLVLWAGWASGYGTVSISSSTALASPSASPDCTRLARLMSSRAVYLTVVHLFASRLQSSERASAILKTADLVQIATHIV